MPLDRHAPAHRGVVVAPVRELGTHRDHAADPGTGRGQRGSPAAEAVPDDMDLAARPHGGGIAQHGLAVPRAPVGPACREAAQAVRTRFAYAPVVVGDDVHAVVVQVLGEAEVIAALDRGGRVDDHHRPRHRAHVDAAPDEAAQRIAVVRMDDDGQRGGGPGEAGGRWLGQGAHGGLRSNNALRYPARPGRTSPQGARPGQSAAAHPSAKAAAASNSKSRPGAPISCAPSGNPAGPRPMGRDKAGRCRKVHSPP